VSKPEIFMIAALDRDRVIGNAGELPWKLPDDMRHFRAMTVGKPCVMGKKTWDTMHKPLADRPNIVLSRSSPPIDGAIVVRTRDEVMALPEVAGAKQLAVIGGGEIYTLFLPIADRLELTLVHANLEGDARFPEWRDGGWVRTRNDLHPTDEKHAYAFEITTWKRASPPP
jgi:dihydrofolate reductase